MPTPHLAWHHLDCIYHIGVYLSVASQCEQGRDKNITNPHRVLIGRSNSWLAKTFDRIKAHAELGGRDRGVKSVWHRESHPALPPIAFHIVTKGACLLRTTCPIANALYWVLCCLQIPYIRRF